MEPTPTNHPLTPDLIHHLLLEDARAEMPAEYVRLMEVYCVVKAGGVVVQMEVAKRLEQMEKAALQAEIDCLADQPDQTSRVRALRQEIEELARSREHRLAFLAAITPEEEAGVRQCLGKIDAYFRGLGVEQ